MRLRAKVTLVTGRTIHSLGAIVDGQPVPVERLPDPAWIEIVELTGSSRGYSLQRFTSDGEYITDTWHMTLDDAKHQGDLEFGELAWEEVDDDKIVG